MTALVNIAISSNEISDRIGNVRLVNCLLVERSPGPDGRLTQIVLYGRLLIFREHLAAASAATGGCHEGRVVTLIFLSPRLRLLLRPLRVRPLVSDT